MAKSSRKEVRAHGVCGLLSAHPEIRKLKRSTMPSLHGNKLWSSSWLLMDYFRRRGFMEGARVMEVGCGWGLAGICCARRHGARVTAVDKDPEVFPYLLLHAKINMVKIATIKKGFAGIGERDLKSFDVIIGADICFWDTMVNPLRRMISRALRAGVKLVLIADPGRQPFETMGEYFVEKARAQVFDWATQRPRPISGRILRITPKRKQE